MSDVLTIEEIDPATLRDDQWRALHRLRVETDREELPDDQPAPFEEVVAELRTSHPGSRTRRWAAWDAGQAAGYAFVNVDLNDNLHLAWSWVCVAPSHRRQGIGTRLVRAVVAASIEEGRRSIGVDFRHGSIGAVVAPLFGFEEKSIEHHNRTHVASVDRTMIDSWVARARERAGGYALESWTGPTPEDRLEEYARVFNVMNTAPRDDLDVGDRRMTAELMREREATMEVRGVEKWVTAAVAPDGSFAGFTEMFFSRWRDDVAHQGNTGVDPDHRNLGIGRWLKAAMFLRLREERPSVEKIDTWNAGSNEPMLAINHAMGFAPVNVWSNAQADVERVRALLEERMP